LKVRHASFVEPPGDDRQHRGELAEEHDFAASVEELLVQKEQLLQLGALRDTGSLRELDEARIAAHLAELEESVEEDDLALCEAAILQSRAHPLLHRQPHRLLQVPLATREVGVYDDLGLGWQLGEHLGLGAPQDERGDPIRKALHPRGVVVALDGTTIKLSELIGAAEDAGLDEIEDRV